MLVRWLIGSPLPILPLADSSHGNEDPPKQPVFTKCQFCGGVARMTKGASSLDFLCSCFISGSDKRAPGDSNTKEQR